MLRKRMRIRRLRRWPSEISLAFLELHGAFFVVIDHAVLSLGPAETHHLFNDRGHRVRVRLDGAGARYAAQRAHAAFDFLRALSRQKPHAVLSQEDGIASPHGFAFL